jgi:hypothetical protein
MMRIDVMVLASVLLAGPVDTVRQVGAIGAQEWRRRCEDRPAAAILLSGITYSHSQRLCGLGRRPGVRAGFWPCR